MQAMFRNPSGGSTHLDSPRTVAAHTLERLSSQLEVARAAQFVPHTHPINAHPHSTCMPPPAPLFSAHSAPPTIAAALQGDAHHSPSSAGSLFARAISVLANATLQPALPVALQTEAAVAAEVAAAHAVQSPHVLSQLLAMLGAAGGPPTATEGAPQLQQSGGGSLSGGVAPVVYLGIPVESNLAVLAGAARQLETNWPAAAPPAVEAPQPQFPPPVVHAAAAASAVSTGDTGATIAQPAMQAPIQTACLKEDARPQQAQQTLTENVQPGNAAEAAVAASDAQYLPLLEMHGRIEEVMNALQMIGSIRKSIGATYMKIWACLGEQRQRQAYDILRSALLRTQPQDAVQHIQMVLAHNVTSVGGDSLAEAAQ